MTQGGKIDLRSLLQIAKRWKWLLIAPPILALIGAYAYVATTPMLYTSSTTIMFGSNQAVTTDMRNLAGTQPQRQVRMIEIGENIRQQLLADSTLNKVLNRAGFKPTSKMLERAKEILQTQPEANEQEILRRLQLEWLAQKVETSLTFPKRGNYIQLSITHANPDQAYKLTKYLAEVFIEESLYAEGLGPRETLEFASKQLEMYERKLEEAREQLRQFKTGVVREQTKNLGVNVQNEAQIGSQIKSLAVDITGKRSQLESIENQMGAMKGRIAIPLSGRAAGLRAQMMEKIANVALLMLQADWRDPQVIKLNQDIATLREELQQEIQTAGANGAANGLASPAFDLAVQRQMALTDLELLNRHKAVLESLVENYKQNLTLAPSRDLQLAQLQNNVDTYEEIVKTFEQQARSSEIIDALRLSDAETRYKITAPATRPITPDTAQQPKILLMAFFGGLGFGFGLVYLIEFFDHSFKSVEEVEKFLGLTVLGTVPKLDLGEK